MTDAPRRQHGYWVIMAGATPTSFRARTRDVLLPILLYPITVPVIIAGVRGTSALLASPVDEPAVTMWLSLLVAFDVVFVTLSLWTFEPLMTE